MVQADFVGLPGWDVVFTRLSGSFMFAAGDQEDRD